MGTLPGFISYVGIVSLVWPSSAWCGASVTLVPLQVLILYSFLHEHPLTPPPLRSNPEWCSPLPSSPLKHLLHIRSSFFGLPVLLHLFFLAAVTFAAIACACVSFCVCALHCKFSTRAPSNVLHRPLCHLFPSSGEEEVAHGMKVWRKALTEVRSAAQLAMCIQQLQKSIAWERSIMKVVSSR